MGKNEKKRKININNGLPCFAPLSPSAKTQQVYLTLRINFFAGKYITRLGEKASEIGFEPDLSRSHFLNIWQSRRHEFESFSNASIWSD